MDARVRKAVDRELHKNLGMNPISSEDGVGIEGLPKNRTILNESLRRELGNKEAFYHETKTLLSRANHSCGKAA